MLALSLAVLLTTSSAYAQSFSGSGDSVDKGAPATPDYYTVQTGDTLWDISRTFLGNPDYWPRLWSINDYITNPHWIYPGNRIAFRMGTDVEPPAVDLQVTEPELTQPGALSFEYPESQCGPDVRFTRTLPSNKYDAIGFLADSDDVEVYGKVYKARSGHFWLSQGNLIYMKMDDADAYDCGDTVSVFRRTEKTVRDPNEHKTKYGSAYRLVGEARVVHRVGDIVAAVVRNSYTEIQRGDLVGPLMPVQVELEVRQPDGHMAGHVIGRPTDENILVSTGETVFLDVGRSDGARVGDSFYTVEQRDDAIDTQHDDDTLPESVTGRIVLVRVDEYTSTGIISDASRPIESGQRIVQVVDDQ